MTHTPGPWFVDQQGAPTIRTGDGTPICGAPRNPADAPILAAAPDLLAGAEKLVWYIEQFHPNAPSRSPEREMLINARALIARAKG